MEDAAQHERRRLPRRWLFSLCVIVVGFLIVEAAFRVLGITGYHVPRERDWRPALLAHEELTPGVRVQFRPHSSFQLRYHSNPRNYFEDSGGITYRLNNVGFRDHDYQREKPEGVQRIVILGDSFAFGEGVRVEHMFTNRVEAMLNGPQRPVEVLNFSVGGWGTLDQIAFLDHVALEYRPDLVLVAYVLNDADYAGDLDIWDDFLAQSQSSRLRHSYVLSFAYARTRQRFFVGDFVRQMVTNSLRFQEQWGRSMGELDRGRRLAETSGARFGVVILPFLYDLSASHPFLPVIDLVQENCTNRGIPVRDLFPAFEGKADRELWVHPIDPHPNDIAHALIAGEVVDFIRAEFGIGQE